LSEDQHAYIDELIQCNEIATPRSHHREEFLLFANLYSAIADFYGGIYKTFKDNKGILMSFFERVSGLMRRTAEYNLYTTDLLTSIYTMILYIARSEIKRNVNVFLQRRYFKRPIERGIQSRNPTLRNYALHVKEVLKGL